MKKLFAFVLASILGISACMVVFAAPSAEAPSEVSVTQDEKNHSVYVFGTALALVFEDGSIEISSIGPAGRVDVMMDGVVIQNVASVQVPAGQRTRMALEEGSIIVKNVTEESGEAVKKQIEETYAAGVESIDPASLAQVTAYKVNKAGDMEGADGQTVSAGALEMSVSSVDATAESFEELMEEIIAEDKAREAAEAAVAAANENQSSSSSSGSSGSSSSGSTPSATPEATKKPDSTPAPTPDNEEEVTK